MGSLGIVRKWPIGLKNDSSLIDGYQIFHNYIRPHMSLYGKTPSEACWITKGDDKWKTLIENAVIKGVANMSSTKEEGWKDKEIYEKCKTVTIECINELHRNNVLKMEVTLEEDAFTSKVMDRINSTAKSRSKLESLVTSDKANDFLKAIEPFGLSENDIMNIYGSTMVLEILDAYELFKKYLLITLDKDELVLTGKEPLGSLLARLSQRGINNRFDECMDKELRIALAHGSFWFENNKFYYVVDPTLKRTKSLSLGELFIKMREVQLFAKSFLENSFPRIAEIKKSL